MQHPPQCLPLDNVVTVVAAWRGEGEKLGWEEAGKHFCFQTWQIFCDYHKFMTWRGFSKVNKFFQLHRFFASFECETINGHLYFGINFAASMLWPTNKFQLICEIRCEEQWRRENGRNGGKNEITREQRLPNIHIKVKRFALKK